jgi:endonuclease YncB( thermonuclease family)
MRLWPGILCALLLLLSASAARGATGPCRPGGTGPDCQVWKGKAVDVNDGDTIDVDIDRDGSRRRFTVRFIGVQSMELTRYNRNPRKRRGCNAVEAADFVERLVRRGRRRVRLAAQSPRKDSEGRLFRSVAVKVGGRWRDVGEMEMARGLTLWMNVKGETAWNRRYNVLGQQAAGNRLGLWNPAACRAGPSQDASLGVAVMSDPVGEDGVNLNSEYVRVRNLGAKPVSLARWWVRDSGLRRYPFPAGTVVAPGETITVHSGRGRPSGSSFYWGLPGAVFENSAPGGDQGDGAYLFDPDGDLRGHMVYPCLVACSDPNQGALRVTHHAIGPEYVLVQNVSGRAIDLFGYELRTPGGYAFGRDSVLLPGETLEVRVKGDPSSDTRLLRHMGIAGPYLPDSGGAVKLTTLDEIVLACDSWGAGSC